MSDKYYFESGSANAGSGVIDKGSKKGLNAGLILFIIGFIITSVGMFMCHTTDLNKYYKTKDYSSTFSADKVKNINISDGIGDFDVKKRLRQS